MKLDDFLKCKKVRCISKDCPNLTIGKTYEVLGVTRSAIKTIDNDNEEWWSPICCFEPVIDSAENPLQNIELTPEFETEASEPKFKVGDKAYYGNRRYLLEIIEIRGCMARVRNGNYLSDAHINYLCHATQENYEMLCKLYPNIEFEQPAKELKGSDLCRAMLDKGWVSVPCYISDESDYEADNNAFCALIGRFDKCFKELATNYEHEYAVPFDPRTGEPLTESVLNG